MKILILPLFLAVFQTTLGQLVTFPSSNPIDLSQGEILGVGASISNINHTGDSFSIGYFNAENSNINLSEGILLTTGTIFHFNNNGPHGPNNSSNAGFNNNGEGCSLLSNLIDGSPTYNCSSLEFDFIPQADSIQIKYIFGSDEFPEYTGSNFKDIVGIFITGPEFPNPVNIAKLYTGDDVSINTIDMLDFYYVNNGNGAQSPFNTSDQYIQYDGYTIPLYAKANVTNGETYHLQIVIADVMDGIIDSGVFIETEGMNVGFAKSKESQNEINIYPNPIQDHFTLKLKLMNTESVSYTLINTLGQQIHSEELGYLTQGEHKYACNFNHIKTGVYFLKIKIGNETITQRVVVK
jgi:hypothetical protein